MLELEDVTKVYSTGAIEVRALDGVSLNVDEGEMVVIMGHSGSGKSTMMNILGCLDAPTNGRYRLDGVDVAALDAPQRHVGLELAQHADGAQRHPVDQQVLRRQVELQPGAVRRGARVADPHRLAAQPGPGEAERLGPAGSRIGREVVEQRAGASSSTPGRTKPSLPQPVEQALGLVLRAPAAAAGRSASGSPSGSRFTAPKSSTTQPAVVEQPEVAGVRVGVQQPGPRGPGEQEARQQQAGAVALLPGAGAR